jgi:hypothetical protein
MFKGIATIYDSIINTISKPLDSIPTMLAEDKTMVKRSMRWIVSNNVLLGFCGLANDHECVLNFVIIVRSRMPGYENIVAIVAEGKVGD